MSKQAKNRPKLPKPVFGWAVVNDGKIQGDECFNTRSDADWYLGYRGNDIIRVRIVPVVANRRKGAK